MLAKILKMGESKYIETVNSNSHDIARNINKTYFCSMIKGYITIVLLMITSQSFSQIHVRGTIYDGYGEKVRDVVISLTGTDICSTSDSNGRYKITVPDGKATIVYNKPSFNSLKVRVKRKYQIDVVLIENEEIDKNVAVGYGIQSSGKITGAVGTIGTSTRTQPSYVVSYKTVNSLKK